MKDSIIEASENGLFAMIPNDALLNNYEPCGICGYDHQYDFDYLVPEELDNIVRLHIAEGSCSKKEVEGWKDYQKDLDRQYNRVK